MPADNLATAEALPCRAAHDADVVAARDQVLNRRLRNALFDRDDDSLREVSQVPARKIDDRCNLGKTRPKLPAGMLRLTPP